MREISPMLTEKELIQRLTEQQDGNHNYAFTVSVAKSILRLRERYARQPQNFETIALELQEKKFSQDSTITQEKWDTAVRYLLAKVSENQDAFDVVKLYFRVHGASVPCYNISVPCYNIIEHKISLKETLILIWLALHDDKAYERHYSGSDLEKLQQAKADI